MSLTTCPDCGKQISEAAPACIHCGRPAFVAPRQVAAPLVSPPKSALTKDLGAAPWLILLSMFLAIWEPARPVAFIGFLIGLVLVIVRVARRD